jgi:hypothetical protein
VTRSFRVVLVAGALAAAGCGSDDGATSPDPLAAAPAVTVEATPAPVEATPSPPATAEAQPTTAPPATSERQPTAGKDRRRAVRRLLRQRPAAARRPRLAAPAARPGMRPVTGSPENGQRRRLTAPGGMAPVASPKRAPARSVNQDGTGGMTAMTAAPGS